MMEEGMDKPLIVEAHPLLDLRAFAAVFPGPLKEIQTSDEVLALLRGDGSAPMESDDDVRAAVRDLLRHGGFKPTGRSKPASEYLLKAADEGTLESINPAVDICNVVSLHSGLPISVVDLDLVSDPMGVDVATEGVSYVFNASGQTIDIGGLLCFFDAEEPCASPVKDSHRTKTGPDTRRTLTLIWGSNKLSERVDLAEKWYRELLEQHGADVELWEL